jgi:uncharacterized protein
VTARPVLDSSKSSGAVPRRLALLLVGLATAAAPLSAQRPAAPPSAATAARVVTPASLRAAEELLRLMSVEEVIRVSVTSAFDSQIEQQPLMAPFRATMQAWVDKHLTWAELGTKLARVYAEQFTEEELKQLIAFYQTPVGRKVAAAAPTLARRGAEVGAQVADAHKAELEQMIRARAAELQAGDATP